MTDTQNKRDINSNFRSFAWGFGVAVTIFVFAITYERYQEEIEPSVYIERDRDGGNFWVMNIYDNEINFESHDMGSAAHIQKMKPIRLKQIENLRDTLEMLND